MFKKIIISIYLGFVLFCTVTLFLGSVGINNYTKLKYFKNSLVEHVDSLEMKSVLLNDEINRLSTSDERLKIAVRPLGYVEPGQKVIKVLLSKLSNPLYNIDRQYDIPEFKYTTGNTLLVSSLFTVILFVISLLIGVVRDTYKRR